MIESLFIEMSMIIVLAVVISGIMKLLRQPIIIGYIFTGIIAGPLFMNMVTSTDMVATLSHFGIVFLLFVAGLSLNPKVMKSVGKISIVTGVGQVLFTTVIGFLIAKLLGFPDIPALYIAIALTFSSTIIIVKLLSDKGDMQTLYGRISLGFLVVQDIIVVIIMMFLSSFTGGFDILDVAIETVLIGLGLMSFMIFFGIFVLPRIIRLVAKTQEFLILFSLGWLLSLAIVFSYLNFSIEIGALLAGIMLSFSPYHYEIKLKMNVLRDFFILFFFVLLGSQMIFTNVTDFILPIVVFSVFILVGNPLIVMILMGAFKYTKRNGFLAGLTVAQISEFSLILVALGVKMGHVSNDILSMITAIGLITILGSTYMIMHANKIYSRVSRYLGVFERKGMKKDEHSHHRGGEYDVILFGCNRIGFSLLETIGSIKKKLLIIDNDPEIITNLATDGYECKYGDAEDTELLNATNFSTAKMVISTIPDIETNLILLRKIRKLNNNIIIIIVSHQIEEALQLYESGATYVLMPYFLGGQHASTLIQKVGMDLNEFTKEKARHMSHLKKRSKLKHAHPEAEKHR